MRIRHGTLQVRVLPTLVSLASHMFFSLLAYCRTIVIANIAGVYSLFPLLFTLAGECHGSSS